MTYVPLGVDRVIGGILLGFSVYDVLFKEWSARYYHLLGPGLASAAEVVRLAIIAALCLILSMSISGIEKTIVEYHAPDLRRLKGRGIALSAAAHIVEVAVVAAVLAWSVGYVTAFCTILGYVFIARDIQRAVSDQETFAALGMFVVNEAGDVALTLRHETRQVQSIAYYRKGKTTEIMFENGARLPFDTVIEPSVSEALTRCPKILIVHLDAFGQLEREYEAAIVVRATGRPKAGLAIATRRAL